MNNRPAFAGVDHVVVRVKDAAQMMDLFADILGLPVSWPLQTTDFASYGWVTLGNVNLEFWAAANNSDLPGDDVLPLFHGLALEPNNLATDIATLRGRGISCKTPRPYVTQTEDGRDMTNFTNAVVLDVSNPLQCIFFCEWESEGTIFPWSEKLSTTQRKLKEQRQLSACTPGKLGVTGLVEVQLSATRLNETQALWMAITGQDFAPIKLADVMGLSLQAGDADRIETIVIGVHSLDNARRFLTDAGLLGESSESEISLLPSACGGLRFRFRQT